VSNGKSKGEKGRAAWEVDFVHLELDGQQKKAVQTWDTSGEATFKALSDCTLAGWKLSLVFDARNDCYIGSLTSPKMEGQGRQVCFSGRGPDLMAAMRVMAFKLVYVLDGDLQTLRETAEARSQWG